MFQSRAIDPSLHKLKHALEVTKSLKSNNNQKLRLCLK